MLLFRCSGMSDSLQPHGLQCARFPCPSPTSGACSNTCPLSWDAIQPFLSSVVPFSPCLQSFPASRFFLMSKFFTAGGQSIGASASTSVPPVNIHDWFPSGLTGLSCRTGDSQESSPTSQFESINSLVFSLLYDPILTSIHDYWKNHSFDYPDLCRHCCCCCCSVASVVSDSVQPHRRQPTRHPRPWDSPGKNTGVGCHFLLQCMKVKSEREVAQSCPTPSDPMECSLPGSSVHGIFQVALLGTNCCFSYPSLCNKSTHHPKLSGSRLLCVKVMVYWS